MSKASVAFRLNGGMGTFIMEMNFIQYFYDKFSECVDISVFSFSEKTSMEIYGEQYFVSHYGSRGEFFPEDHDLAVDINWFVKVVQKNDKALREADESGELFALVKTWIEFAENSRTKHFFTPDTNMFDPNIHVFATAKRQNRLQIADIDGSLGVSKHYRFTVLSENDEEVLQKFGLEKGKYITIQQGVDAACNTQFSPKQWPNEYYSELCDICHSRFPGIKLVQLGELENNLPVENADLCLLGETTLAELKVVLKNALLHVDGDCGMVHLRRAMHAGPNIVMYGNLPDNVYGYNEDHRVRSNVCKYGCAKMFDAWKRRCYKGTLPECMTAIRPEKIADIIGSHLDALDKGEYVADEVLPENKPPMTPYEKIIADPNIHIDMEWAEGWLKDQELFAYSIEQVKISDLKFIKLTSQGDTVVPLTKCPAYQHLQGDKKAYPRYMKLYQKYQPDTERSEQRFMELLESLDRDDYDASSLIVVNGVNKIMDGAHRASWLMNKYGEDHVVTVLKVYGMFGL